MYTTIDKTSFVYTTISGDINTCIQYMLYTTIDQTSFVHIYVVYNNRQNIFCVYNDIRRYFFSCIHTKDVLSILVYIYYLFLYTSIIVYMYTSINFQPMTQLHLSA